MNLESGVRRTATTALDGSYGVSSLPAGKYKVMVRKHGFRTMARLGVKLELGEAAQVDFDLGIGGMQEVVTIEGSKSTINTEDATSGIAIDSDLADRLPINGRTLQGLISFAPGVVATPATLGEAGQFSVNGQRPNANYFVVDGMSLNSGVSGSGIPGQFSGGTLPAMTAVGSLHALATATEVREVRVQTSTFAPEFGRMPGAQVQVSTRAGSNEWHGQGFFAFRHERLSANDTLSKGGGLPRAPLRLHDMSLSLGGPVRENRTFFFASSEVLRLRQPAAWRMAVPSLEARGAAASEVKRVLEAFPLPNRPFSPMLGEATVQTSWPAQVTTGSIRIDQAIGAQGAFFVRYNEAPSSNRIGFIQSNESEYRTRSLTAAFSSAHEGSILNDARVNVSNTRVRSSWLPGMIGAGSLPALLDTLGRGISYDIYGLSIGGLGQLVSGGPNNGTSSSRQGQLQIVDTLAIGSGRHQGRFGIDYQRLTPFRDKPISSIAGRFPSLQELLSGQRPEVVYALAPGGSSLIETLSAFAQDTWSVNPRLNLTYGIRWEFMPPPTARIDGQTQALIATNLVAPGTLPLPVVPPPTPVLPISSAIPVTTSQPEWKSRFGRFAPRAGLAYRLNEAGDFVLRAGFGVFYDLGFASAIDPLNGAPFNTFNSWRTTLLAFEAPSVMAYGFSSDLTIPYSSQWNITIEKGLGREGILSTAWVGSRGRRLLRREGYVQPDTNLPKLLVATSSGRSDYQSFQAHYRRSLSRGLRGLASYTWSHSTDNGSWDSGSYLVIEGHDDRGPSNFDVRHSFSAGFSYDLPRRVFSRFGHGWSLNSIVRARTGFPIDLLARENAFGLGFDNAPRPDLIPNVPVWIRDASTPGGRRLNPAAFREPVSGPGTLGRNALRGMGFWQADASLDRRFMLPNDSALHVRLQVYNLTNTPALGDPVRVLNSPLFGQPVTPLSMMLGTGRPASGLTPAFQIGGPRTVEVGLSWKF